MIALMARCIAARGIWVRYTSIARFTINWSSSASAASLVG
jgi:hypothetical protein